MALLPGIRVIRGPNWSGKDQDGGSGHVGTVVNISESAKGKVTVLWDCGREFQYNAGRNGKFELTIFDTGPSGVTHNGITCDVCNQDPVIGMRWKCTVCTNFDLCSVCYMQAKHDVTHPFLRHMAKTSSVVRVPPRSGCAQSPSWGLFVGAEVIRGPHWRYGNQDGGDGTIGEVVKLGTWTGGFARGAVNVRWRQGQDSVKGYCTGAEGRMELITVTDAMGWPYYRDHLPVLDVLNPEALKLKKGDKVQVNLDFEAFKLLQRDHVGWKDDMKQCVEQVGTVVDVTDDKCYVEVQYEDAAQWKVVISSLTKMHSFSVGDCVRIIDKYNPAVQLQEGHGGWNDDMENSLGKVGKIIKIDDDGDLQVLVGDRKWFFSPVTCRPEDKLTRRDSESSWGSASSKLSESTSSSSSSDFDFIPAGVADALLKLLKNQCNSSDKPESRSLVQAAANGDVHIVRDIIKAGRTQINKEEEGVTALQMASFKGHRQVVEILLKNKADINKADKDGDSSVHYAVSGENRDICVCLLEKGAKKDLQNKGGLTPLHLAVFKQNSQCVTVLLDKGCNPNTQDEDGDTPLHDAIIKDDKEIIQALLDCGDLDVTLSNNEGKNAFHEACSELEGDLQVPCTVMQIESGIANVPTTVGRFYPLHIAAANGFVPLAGSLITQGKANVNVQSEDMKTPLHMAVCVCNLEMVQLFIESGADVNIQDSDGNTALHTAQLGGKLDPALKTRTPDQSIVLEIKCYLAECGADVTVKNKGGKSPLDLVANPEVRMMLERVAKRLVSRNAKGKALPAHWVAMEGNVKLVSITAQNPLTVDEYNNVAKNMNKTLSNRTIISIQRVQNVALWEHYIVTKANFEREYGRGQANEMHLFHGTLEKFSGTIPHQNIDPKLAGQRAGAVFGLGAYFAVDAKYSDNYAAENVSSHRFMFMAKVLVGKYRKGMAGITRPLILNANDPKKLADSAVDDELRPKVYVIFESHQIYPEYLIEYM